MKDIQMKHCCKVLFVQLTQRRGKHFVSLHDRDKRVFIFPNTPQNVLLLPKGYNICSSIESFKIKTLKGGFQRRPELIANCVDNSDDEVSSESQIRACRITESENDPDAAYEHPKPETMRIQLELAERALRLLDLFLPQHPPERPLEQHIASETTTPVLTLDVGCGNGISMAPLLNQSSTCIGVDLNLNSLRRLKQNSVDFASYMCNNRTRPQTQSEGSISPIKNMHCSWAFDTTRWDARHGLPFRDNVFDLCISISFLQWLFYGQRPQQLGLFFSSLQRVLRPGGKSVIQFYPRSPKQVKDAIYHASKYFQGAVVGDYPHIDRGRKLFLLLIKS